MATVGRRTAVAQIPAAAAAAATAAAAALAAMVVLPQVLPLPAAAAAAPLTTATAAAPPSIGCWHAIVTASKNNQQRKNAISSRGNAGYGSRGQGALSAQTSRQHAQRWTCVLEHA